MDTLPLVLALTLTLMSQCHGATLQVAWLAPKSQPALLEMQAASSLGGLALAVDAVEDDTSLLGSDTLK